MENPLPKLITRILWFLIFGGLLWALSNCGPARRLERFHKKHPYLFETITDTIIVKDTLRLTIPGVSADTVILRSHHYHDTVIIQKEHLTTRLYFAGDTVYVHSACDTIFKEVIREVKIPQTQTKAKIYRQLFGVPILQALTLLLFSIIALLILKWYIGK